MRKIILVVSLGLVMSAQPCRAQSFCLADFFQPYTREIDTVGRGTFDKSTLWDNGSTITVGFLNGTKRFRDTVKKYASEWMRYANLKFIFTSDEQADIRVKYERSNGSWSYLGNAALEIRDPGRPTLLIGADTTWADTNLMKELKRHILHEFGHAIGLQHEHMSPVSGIKWNEELVYKRFLELGWDSAMVRGNILTLLEEGSTNGKFDLTSIMLYSFDNSLIGLPDTAEQYLTWNTSLSQGDKETIAYLYPRDSPPGKSAPYCNGACAAISIITEESFLKVYPSFRIYNAGGKEIEIYVFFYDGDENPIINRRAQRYIGEDGQLIGYRKLRLASDDEICNNSLLRISVATPLSDFNISRGQNKSISFRFVVRLDGKELIKSDFFYRRISYEPD